MSTLIIKTNVSQGTDVLVRDMGIVIPASGGSETLSDLNNITNARESIDLYTWATDNAFGAGSSTLILNDGTSDIPQGDIDYWLAVLSGLLGPTGTQGITGAEGLGETGLQGVTGTADVLRGSIPFPTPPKDREFYWYEDEQTLFMYEGVTAMAWVDISSGSKIGVTGIQGVTGAGSVKYQYHSAFVSIATGNDTTAELEDPSKPYKTIQAALDDIEIEIPSETNRWIVFVEQGHYPEDIVMLDWVVVRGPAGTNAIIEGTVTFDNAINYQSELELIGIEQTNAPCIICSAGADEAYIGLRTCWLTSTYDNDALIKSTFDITRGDAYLYGATEVDLYVTSNNVGLKYDMVFYVHGDDVAWLENIGTVSYCVSSDTSNSTGFITSTNTNPGTKVTWFQGYGFMELTDASSANIAGVSSQIAGDGLISFRDFTCFNTFGASNTIKYLLSNASNNLSSTAITRFFNCDILFEDTLPYEQYMAQAVSPNDTVRIWDTYIQTDGDDTPVRYEVSGYSGVVDYSITNTFGTISQTGRLEASDHGFFGKYIRVGGLCTEHSPTGGEIQYDGNDILGYVDGQWKSLTQSTSTGIEGQTGAQGQTGSQGNTGAQGVTGAQGFTGAQGTTGVQGTTGSQGTTGVQGVTGLIGITGAQGVTGLIGTTGAHGTTGLIGITGLRGITGIQGTTGIQGVTGLIGTTGAQGVTGLIGTTGLSGYRTFHIFADQMDVPSTSNWPVTGIAPAAVDTTNSALIVRRFDDTAQEGAGFILEIPDSTTNMVFDMVSRAQSFPTGAQRSVTPKIFARTVPSGSAVVGWTGAQMSAITFPTGTTFFSYDSRTVTLSSLNLTAGRVAQFELTRDTTGASGLPGDWSVLEVKATFT